MEPKHYVIFNVSELDKIDFDQVLETSIETIRKSVDGTLTFVKYATEEIPSSVVSLDTKQGPYSYEEILEILSTPEWTDPNPSYPNI
jgi:tRNA A37 threonylcarbamoyladenosine synthetase subunit TsaC/SUA5/YrdC